MAKNKLDPKLVGDLIDHIVAAVRCEVRSEVERILKEKEPTYPGNYEWKDVTEEITFKVKPFKEVGGHFKIHDSGYYFIVGSYHGEECFRIDLDKGRLLYFDEKIRYKFYRLTPGPKGSFKIETQYRRY